MPVYAEANRERSEAQKMAERHARNEVNIGLRMTAFFMNLLQRTGWHPFYLFKLRFLIKSQTHLNFDC